MAKRVQPTSVFQCRVSAKCRCATLVRNGGDPSLGIGAKSRRDLPTKPAAQLARGNARAVAMLPSSQPQGDVSLPGVHIDCNQVRGWVRHTQDRTAEAIEQTWHLRHRQCNHPQPPCVSKRPFLVIKTSAGPSTRARPGDAGPRPSISSSGVGSPHCIMLDGRGPGRAICSNIASRRFHPTYGPAQRNAGSSPWTSARPSTSCAISNKAVTFIIVADRAGNYSIPAHPASRSQSGF